MHIVHLSCYLQLQRCAAGQSGAPDSGEAGDGAGRHVSGSGHDKGAATGAGTARPAVGVAALDRPGRDGRELLELLAAADLALYRAKNTGRDRVCLYGPADAGRGASHGIPGASH